VGIEWIVTGHWAFFFERLGMKRIRNRKAVSNFAKHMELRLRENDHKGKEGWRGWAKRSLFGMLLEEVIELCNATDNDNVKQECCDVANFAMMIFDNIDRG
jgi:hypothetical protein